MSGRRSDGQIRQPGRGQADIGLLQRGDLPKGGRAPEEIFGPAGGVLFLLDQKSSPDGQSVVRIYSKNWDFWSLRFTTEDAVQLILKDEDVKTYISYGNGEYEGLW